jgi:hypothetical protein
MCDNVYVVPQYFLVSTLRSVIVFQQEWMVVFASAALGIKKGFFHGIRIWVHIGDMVADYHPSLCRFENSPICTQIHIPWKHPFLIPNTAEANTTIHSCWKTITDYKDK